MAMKYDAAMEYAADDLKRSFPKLASENNFTLVPLLESLFQKWIGEIPNSVVSDVTKGEEAERGEFYYCVVDGKIVDVSVSGIDIDVEDQDESWYMAKQIFFYGKNKEKTEVLFQHFNQFAGGQKLEELVKSARELLKKGKTLHLDRDMSIFYK